MSQPSVQTDKFEKFARQAQQAGTAGLVRPLPIPFEKNVCNLTASTSAPYPVPKDMTTKEELYAALKDLRSQYQPYLRELAPQIPNCRIHLELKEFVLDGKETITIPHYAGPLGNAVQHYTTNFTLDSFENKAVYFC